MNTDTAIADTVARVNGAVLHLPGEVLSPEALRQRACTELLRQAAQSAGLLALGDAAAVDGVISAAASSAIEVLLERNLVLPEPTGEDCRRHYSANQGRYRTDERVRARHILFAVTLGLAVDALRRRAEAILLDLRCRDRAAADGFADAARTWSNCPSGADGGELGWLTVADCAPEFARELFGRIEIGVLPRLVHSRFGLHIVEVLAREPGVQRPFAEVHSAVTAALHRQAYATALRQYLSVLAGQAEIEGVDLAAADTPLLQ